MMSFIQKIASALVDTKAQDIVCFETQGKSLMADYFLVCQGHSQAHVKGIADRVEITMKEQGHRPSVIEGYTEGSWIVMDYHELILHIFHPETRAYYCLEELYSIFPQISLHHSVSTSME